MKKNHKHFINIINDLLPIGFLALGAFISAFASGFIEMQLVKQKALDDQIATMLMWSALAVYSVMCISARNKFRAALWEVAPEDLPTQAGTSFWVAAFLPSLVLVIIAATFGPGLGLLSPVPALVGILTSAVFVSGLVSTELDDIRLGGSRLL